MPRPKSKKRIEYENNEKIADKMLDEMDEYIEQQQSKANLLQISEVDCEASIQAYEDKYFYYSYCVWEYEVREALRDYKSALKNFLSYDIADDLIQAISTARPKRKIKYTIPEGMSKAHRSIAETYYKHLVSTSENIPVHPSNKRKFPEPPFEPKDEPPDSSEE